MPSPEAKATLANDAKFFNYDDLKALTGSLKISVPVVKGKVWPSEDKGPGWTVECEDLSHFKDSVAQMPLQIEFFAFDQSVLDEDTLLATQEDLHHYAEEQGLTQELVSKAISALRSHENEMYAVYAYAFLKSGHVFFVRTQSELARYVFHPQKLLSSEGLASVRKLKTLIKN